MKGLCVHKRSMTKKHLALLGGASLWLLVGEIPNLPLPRSLDVRSIDRLVGGISCAFIFLTSARGRHSFASVYYKLLELHTATSTHA